MLAAWLLLSLSLSLSLSQDAPPALPLPLIDIPSDLSPPLADGRVDVHGWLWLPTDRDEETPLSAPIAGWFYHHTPEFYHDSPHNFEIMTYGLLDPQTPIQSLLPFPPKAPLVGTEYVFTPPANSLDEIIQGELTVMVGHFTNGSFDTTQYYNLSAVATLNMEYTPVIKYLDSAASSYYPTLPYYSFPRSFSLSSSPSSSSSPKASVNDTQHFYFLHLEQQSPDFDQILHVLIDPLHCFFLPGESWDDVTMVGATFRAFIVNDVYHRLLPSKIPVLLELLTPQSKGSDIHSQCKVEVIEEVHCVTVPDSFAVCPPPNY